MAKRPYPEENRRNNTQRKAEIERWSSNIMHFWLRICISAFTLLAISTRFFLWRPFTWPPLLSLGFWAECLAGNVNACFGRKYRWDKMLSPLIRLGELIWILQTGNAYSAQIESGSHFSVRCICKQFLFSPLAGTWFHSGFVLVRRDYSFFHADTCRHCFDVFISNAYSVQFVRVQGTQQKKTFLYHFRASSISFVVHLVLPNWYPARCRSKFLSEARSICRDTKNIVICNTLNCVLLEREAGHVLSVLPAEACPTACSHRSQKRKLRRWSKCTLHLRTSN